MLSRGFGFGLSVASVSSFTSGRSGPGFQISWSFGVWDV